MCDDCGLPTGTKFQVSGLCLRKGQAGRQVFHRVFRGQNTRLCLVVVRKVSNDVRNVSDGAKKVSDGSRKVF